MISSNDRKGNYLRCINLGVDFYLVKPFDYSEFHNAIIQAFRIESDNPIYQEEITKRELNILLVDDNKINQKIMAKMLNSLGHKVEIAEEGYDGYIMAKNKKYDIIFMDLLMPEMDGFEAARRIMEVHKDMIIVAFTADNMPETRKKAELCGIKEFIPKPVRMDDLKKLFIKYFSYNN